MRYKGVELLFFLFFGVKGGGKVHIGGMVERADFVFLFIFVKM